MRSWSIVLLAILFVAGCTSTPSDPYAKAPSRTEMKTQTVGMNQVYAAPFGSQKDHPLHARVHVNVTSGGPIDVFLATQDMCGLYGTRNFTAVAQALNVTDAILVGDFPAPNATNTNCVVLDNTPFAGGKATPTGNVTVDYTIDLWSRAG